MPSLAQSNRFLRLSLVSHCATASLAAPTLASHLGIRLEEAAARLSSAPATLAERVETGKAKRLAALLKALGVAVQLDPSHSKHTAIQLRPPVFDLAIQPVEANNIEQLVDQLSRVLPPLLLMLAPLGTTGLHKALAGPNGLVLKNLTSQQINQTRRVLRKVSGLRLATSSPATALFDIFPDPRISRPLPNSLSPALRQLGLSNCDLTGAVATRVDQSTCAHILKRFKQHGLVAMNRDFQRFDLFLTGVQNLSPRELADFLVARSHLPRHSLESLAHPLRIETGLTRANTLAFQADYAALGLQTCARLRVFYPIRQSSSSRIAP